MLHVLCFFFKLSGAPIVESVQPLTKEDFFYGNMFDILLRTDYTLQLYQSASAGGNMSKVTLLKELNVQFRDGWMHVYYMWGIPFPEPSLGLEIQGG